MAKQKLKTEDISIDSVLELTQNPHKLAWINFKAGFLRGLGGILGAAVAVVLIGFLVAYLGGIPWIGSIIQKIGEAARIK